MPAPRRLLVDLALAALADAHAEAEELLVITPDGVLKRQKATPIVNSVTFGPGTFPFIVPAGVTNLQVEAQAAGGGAVGNGPSSNLGASQSSGGGGGEYLTAGIVVTPGETLTVVVGAGGAGGAGYVTTPQPGHSGGNGFLIIRW
jgi:hypothetical protein